MRSSQKSWGYSPDPGNRADRKTLHPHKRRFDYAKNLCFSEGAVEKAMDAIRSGACIVTDTQMAKAGINKRALARYGGEAYCFMSDEDVAALAKKNGTTRATASMDKAAEMDKKLIFAIGNAPTALVRLYELIENGKLLLS